MAKLYYKQRNEDKSRKIAPSIIDVSKSVINNDLTNKTNESAVKPYMIKYRKGLYLSIFLNILLTLALIMAIH